mgnify:CR=1 FL=1
MDTKKLDKWADLLLDTGKRNNLINFKDTRASTVEVLLPSSDVLFEKVDGTVSFEVFDPKLLKKMMTQKNPVRRSNCKSGHRKSLLNRSSCKSGHRKSLLNRSSCRLRCQKRLILLAAKLHFWLNIPVKSSGRIKSYFIMLPRIRLLP